MTTIPTYIIDLDRPEADRWDEVMFQEKAVARQLVADVDAEFQRVPEVLRWVFAWLYHAFGGLYQAEIAAWAQTLGVTTGTATMLNCAYELSHLRLPKLFGCTTGVCWMEGLGMVQVRTLDWPLPRMGEATRIFRFRRGSREFFSVGVPGQVSVLSGMLPGAYSTTINWAPPTSIPSFDFGPAFLLRHTLETCDSFAAAVEALQHTPLSTNVFFTICGTEKGQACVIERTARAAAVRSMTGPALAQANHHVAERFARHNNVLDEVEEEGFLDDSRRRAEALCHALGQAVPGLTLRAMADVLSVPPVLSKDTVQQMAFCPATGALCVRRGPVFARE